MSIALTSVRVNPDKYEKGVDAVFVFLTPYINKRGPTPSVKLPLLPRPDLTSGRRPALVMALSKKRLS